MMVSFLDLALFLTGVSAIWFQKGEEHSMRSDWRFWGSSESMKAIFRGEVALRLDRLGVVYLRLDKKSKILLMNDCKNSSDIKNFRKHNDGKYVYEELTYDDIRRDDIVHGPLGYWTIKSVDHKLYLQERFRIDGMTGGKREIWLGRDGLIYKTTTASHNCTIELPKGRDMRIALRFFWHFFLYAIISVPLIRTISSVYVLRIQVPPDGRIDPGSKETSILSPERPSPITAMTPSHDLPKYWTPPNRSEEYKIEMIEVQSGTEEFREVLSEFNKTCADRSFEVTSLKRVQNLGQWNAYREKRRAMDEKNKLSGAACGCNERLMFHGTAADVITAINETGFNRNFCGKNATAYGNGVYFARDASYSASNTYSKADADGFKYMYRVRVLVGMTVLGTHGMKEPPKRQDGSGLYYDTTYGGSQGANDSDAPQIVVVYNDAHVYPEYLLKFRVR